MILLSGCGVKTVFLTNFNNDSIGSPPNSIQANGTIEVLNGAGTILVVANPSGEESEQLWAEISHPVMNTRETALVGRLSSFNGAGEYGFIANLMIPSDAGIVSVQFETGATSPQPGVTLFHLDFMPEGDVRINDSDVRFGSYQRDRGFILSANLNLDSVSPTAEVSLTGAPANGSAIVNIPQSLAFFFEQIRFYVGFQHAARFYVETVLVTLKDN